MPNAAKKMKVLIMGVGNTLLQDDGIGIHITESLKSQDSAYSLAATTFPNSEISILDGGTIGLSLLPEIEDADAVIIVDASEIGERPGTLRIFQNAEIDQQLSGKKRSVHEVALADLFAAASIRGRCPARRALFAIQPGSTDLGLQLTPEVNAAIPHACEAVNDMTRRWMHEN